MLRTALCGSVRICAEEGALVGLSTHPAEHELSEEQSHAVAGLVREELARRRISRQFLADQAKISLSTLEKALSGRRPFTLATLIRLEEALGVRLRHPEPRPVAPVVAAPAALPVGVAAADLGSYARPAVSWIEGVYLTLRPSFGDRRAIYAYRTEIHWDDAGSRLAFRESERVDAAFTQHGVVSVPNQSGHIYLVTNTHGQYRMAILGRPTITGEMHGILTTLQAGPGSQLTPVASPIVLVPMAAAGSAAEFGRIGPDQPCHPRYRDILRRTVEEPFARFLPVTAE
ncbi:helix-turn-helix transcriptional regulator [Inquilinus sp. Marseille-Q2685]|uniref:helix-turn-helix domain-containing protein n=1 Tax=Inquilinus sp. Marseille-Q2685 TaxID=2866581 RepID=UPI001CE419CB|nr:helix-turn-helix transcriptional regulator [Inquilinus sp. Marseille-Q2685]